MRLPRILSLALLGSFAGFVGCDMASVQPDAEPLVAASDSKLRHWTLLDRTDASGTSEVVRAFSSTGADSIGVVVTFEAGTDEHFAEANLEAVFSTLAIRSRKYYRDGLEGVSVVAPREHLQELVEQVGRKDFVEHIEPDTPLAFRYEQARVDLDDSDGQVTPWQVYTANAHEGPAKAGDGRGEVDLDLFIIDTHVEPSDDLNMVSSVRIHDAAETYDSTHGTHIAGIAAARDNDFGIVGVAPGARIHSLDVMRPEGYAYMSDLIAAVEHVMAFKEAHPDRPVVVNMSVGARLDTDAYNALDEAVEKAIDMGVTFVIAAGNDGIDARFQSPAHVKGAITVGSASGLGMFSRFSNHGSLIDIVAVGEDIVSTAGGSYFAQLSGSSQATPSVTGAALTHLWQHPDATPEEVRDALVRNAHNSVWRWGLPSNTTRKGVNIPKVR